jgi:hypothetical protein
MKSYAASNTEYRFQNYLLNKQINESMNKINYNQHISCSSELSWLYSLYCYNVNSKDLVENLYHISSDFFFLDWTQGFMHARQVLYHWATSTVLLTRKLSESVCAIFFYQVVYRDQGKAWLILILVVQGCCIENVSEVTASCIGSWKKIMGAADNGSSWPTWEKH